MFSKTRLDIQGLHGLSIPNTFFRQQEETDHLGILLPGYGYTNEMPILYYLRLLLLSRGADVLLVDYEYSRTGDYMSLPEKEQLRWVYADAAAAAAAGLAGRPYRRVTLVGKSLGTLGMGYLVDRKESLPSPVCIWLTPLLTAEVLRTQILRSRPPSLFVIGTGDGYYNPERLAELEAATGGSSLVIPDGDHSLEVKGSALRSVDALRQVVDAAEQYLRQSS